jgi:molecular chaperone DnaK (HSP70)
MTKDNHFLGKFDLKEIPLAANGIIQIEVTFEIDADGNLDSFFYLVIKNFPKKIRHSLGICRR